MEDVATRVLQVLDEGLTEALGGTPVALARFYRTMRAELLDPELRAFASAGETLDDATRCLVLLATRGIEPAWNDRRRSVSHRAIPLRSPAAIERSPMIAGLFEQFDATAIVAGDARAVEDRETFNVFHVEAAAGSPLVPAQDFVERYGIRSVVGFGGFLPPSDLFAAILFFTTPIDATSAALFEPLGLSVKLSLLEHASAERVFA